MGAHPGRVQMQRCTPAPHPPGRAGCSAGRGWGAPGRSARPRAPLTWQKHLCAAVSGGRCSSWPERSSSHTALRRPIRKPQRRSIADPAGRRPAPWRTSTGEQAVRPQMKPAPAPPAPHLPAASRARPRSPASQRPPPPRGTCGRAPAPAPAAPGLPPVSCFAREADERARFPDPPAGPPRPRLPDVASGETRPACPQPPRRRPGPLRSERESESPRPLPEGPPPRAPSGPDLPNSTPGDRTVRNAKFVSLAVPPPPAVCQT